MSIRWDWGQNLCPYLWGHYRTGRGEKLSERPPRMNFARIKSGLKINDVSRRNKGRFDHVTHEEVTDPFGILTVCLVSFLRFGVFGMGKGDKEPCFFQDIENRDPILTGRFHTNFKTAVFCKPVSQFLKPFGEGRETSLLILSSAVCVGNPDAGIDPCFVDIKPTTVFTKDFKSQENNLLRFIVAS